MNSNLISPMNNVWVVDSLIARLRQSLEFAVLAAILSTNDPYNSSDQTDNEYQMY